MLLPRLANVFAMPYCVGAVYFNCGVGWPYAFNRFVRHDSRVESVLVPIADGLTLARKK